MVQPIFYKVDPSDVRHQSGKFGESHADLGCRFKDDIGKVSGWRAALLEASNLAGWTFFGGYEFIDKIVEKISDMFAQVYEPTYLDMPECQVGLDSRVKHMLEILDVGGSDVRMVGIWGIGRIGKTTIAKAVYNATAHKFDGWCFLANVREGSEQPRGLQEALELFSSNALLDIEKLDADEKPIVTDVVHYAEGFPLALEVLGSHLCATSVQKWRAMSEKKRSDTKGCDRITPEHSIKVLEQKALLSVGIFGDIRMHDLLEEMGKVKVLKESTEACERSRLWYYKDVQDVLTKNRVSSSYMRTADNLVLFCRFFTSPGIKQQHLKFTNHNHDCKSLHHLDPEFEVWVGVVKDDELILVLVGDGYDPEANG
ncbi:hypothetical protein ACLB2K_020622 [Fragaria x ananassa]